MISALTVDRGHLGGNLHAKVIQEFVLMVVKDLETILDLVGTDMRRLTSELDHVGCLPLVQLLDMALALFLQFNRELQLKH